MPIDNDLDVQIPDKYLRKLQKFSDETYFDRLYFELKPFHKFRTSTADDHVSH